MFATEPAAGLERRVDPRRYDAMGIEKEADEHLGTQAARFESLGVPTARGLQNEANQWSYIQADLEQKKLAAEVRIDRQLKTWGRHLDLATLSDDQRRDVDREMIRWEQSARSAAEHRAIAANLQQHYDRLRSRAEKVKRMAEKHLKAIDEKRATARQSRNRDRYLAKLEEAQDHLIGLDIMMAEEIAQIAITQSAAARHEARAEVSAAILDGNIKLGVAKTADIERASVPTQAAPTQTTRTPERPVQPITPATKIPTPTPTPPAPAANAIDPALNVAMQKLLADIVKRDRRLVVQPVGLVPVDVTAAELMLVVNEAWPSMQPRLAKIRQHQDAQIAMLIGRMKARPGMLLYKRDDASTWTKESAVSVRDVFKLSVPDREVQAVFSKFGDTPEVRAVVEAIEVRMQAETAALARREREQAEREEALRRRQAAVPQPTPTPTVTDAALAAAEQARKDEAEKRRLEAARKLAEAEAALAASREAAKAAARFVEQVRTHMLRPRVETTEAGMRVTLPADVAARVNLPETAIIADAREQARLEGVLKVNDRAAKRVLAYVAKMPSKVEAGTGGKPATLAASAPQELRDLAARLSVDPEIRRAFENAVVEARLDKISPSRPEAAPQPARKPLSEIDQFIVQGGRFVENPEYRKRWMEEEEAKERNDPNYRGVPTAAQEEERRRRKEEARRKQEQKDAELEAWRRRKIPLSPEAAEQMGLFDTDGPTAADYVEGKNRTLDAWIQANRDGDRDERKRLSRAIRADKELAALAKGFAPGYLAQLEADRQADEAKQDARQNQRDRGLDRKD